MGINNFCKTLVEHKIALHLRLLCRKFLASRREEEEKIKVMGDEEREVKKNSNKKKCTIVHTQESYETRKDIPPCLAR